MMFPPMPTFAAFFRALWEHDPYPWQERLAKHVVSTGTWPDAIGVPTGLGKTASIDVALYALAAEVDEPRSKRRAPRRIVLVVDRRTIVDQAYQRANSIRRALCAAPSGPLADVADRLRACMGEAASEEDPVSVVLLRGGLPRDDGWARRPDQPLIAISTVDQVGSRLLFRGYGVSSRMQSLHAGLLGNDTLFLLDEVHLARPFEETLTQIRSVWRRWTRSSDLPDRWNVVRMSATGGDVEPFDLDASDLRRDEVRRRLQAPKPLRLVQADVATHSGKPSSPTAGWITTLAHHAQKLAHEGSRSIGVVVNRVDTARAVAKALQASERFDVVLLTGRMRPCDRVERMGEVADRAGPDWLGRQSPGARPFICVATQCIEAGADLDFDGLVTEIASYDALVQRFGRANRTGDHEQAPVVVVAPRGIEKVEDPVYGRAPAETWSWLNTLGEDFSCSTEALRELRSRVPSGALPERAHAAVLLPAHLDLLSQTSPMPYPDPEPANYLHGLDAPRPEIQIVWRADLDESHLQAVLEGDPDTCEALAARLDAVPPTSFEALSLPIAAARRWLHGYGAEGHVADVVKEVTEDDDLGRRTQGNRLALAWDGETVAAVRPADLAPGRVYVVPSSYGGLTWGNFDPSGREPITDRGDIGVTARTGRAALRLDAAVHGIEGEEGRHWPRGLPTLPRIPDGETSTVRQAVRQVRAWLAEARHKELEGDLGRLLRHFASCAVRPVGGGWVATGALLSREEVLALVGQDSTKESIHDDLTPVDAGLTGRDTSVFTGAEVELDCHLRGVERWARSMAAACGLPDALVEDLARAARWHDLGKADPRFQVMLHGGDDISAAAGPVLAKSSHPGDREARRRAAQRARLPNGFRHEMASVALLTASPEGRALLEGANDVDLVLHLIASHHGHARPFAPPEDHQAQPEISTRVEVDGRVLTAPGDHGMDALDSGVADRFWELQRRYGWWGLAWLEAILRLADHRESEAEARGISA